MLDPASSISVRWQPGPDCHCWIRLIHADPMSTVCADLGHGEKRWLFWACCWAATLQLSSPVQTGKEAYCTCIAIELCMPKKYTPSSSVGTGIMAQAQINHVSHAASRIIQQGKHCRKITVQPARKRRPSWPMQLNSPHGPLSVEVDSTVNTPLPVELTPASSYQWHLPGQWEHSISPRSHLHSNSASTAQTLHSLRWGLSYKVFQL